MTDLKKLAPDCGDNSCLFGGRGKGGMRTNGGCRCLQGVKFETRRYFEILEHECTAIQKEVEALRAQATKARQEALEEAANAARTLVQSGVTPDGIYHTIRALKQHTGEVTGYVRVPREPTFDQWQAGSLQLKAHNDTPHMESPVRKAVAIAVYKAMITALEDGETKP